ncbi:MAG: hypothetical protein ACREDZ_07025, partial [Kiloniellales bacterium]
PKRLPKMTENRSAQQHSAPKQGAGAAQAQSAAQAQPTLAVEPAKDNPEAAKAAPEMRPDVTAEAAAGNRKSFFKRS